jgi:Putative prokaryotic signal transducing protein
MRARRLQAGGASGPSGFSEFLCGNVPGVPTPTPQDERERLSKIYIHKADEELKKLAADGASLTDAARSVLEAELTRRGLPDTVQGLTKPAIPAPPPHLVTLRQFVSVPEALFAKGLLDSVGIESFLADENIIRIDWFLSNALGGVKLQVRESDAENAMTILDQSISEEDSHEQELNEDVSEGGKE